MITDNIDKNISRRDALKRLGVLAAGVAAASLGMPALSSCSDDKKERIILYFTGTGNCLYVARSLADDHTRLLSIPRLVKQGVYTLEADEIGIVYPVYGHMPPNMVRRYISKVTLRAQYTFAVLTYGNRKCNAVEIWDSISREAGCPFNYITTMIMVDNWLPNFDMNEQMKIDKGIPASLKRIAADIAAHRQWHEPVTDIERRQHDGFMQLSGLDPREGFLMHSADCFVVTDSCIDCGVCTEVCPRGNYSLTARGVQVAGDCDFCFACIQNCPQKAIRFNPESGVPLLAHGEVNPQARYRNEHVSLWDIKNANRQYRTEI